MKNYEVLKGLDTQQLADFLSTNASCDYCILQCKDKENCPTMASCYYRWEEWLLDEATSLLDEYKNN